MTPSSPLEPKHEIRAWVDESTYAALSAQAIQRKISKSEVVRQVLNRHLGEANAAAAAPWLESLLDAVLSKYFQGFPQTLDRLVAASFEQRKWAGTHFVRLIELTGDKNIESQDQRVAKLTSQIEDWARTKADDFFQTLTAPEELIEPDEPSE